MARVFQPMQLLKSPDLQSRIEFVLTLTSEQNLRKDQINFTLRVIEVPKSRVGPKLVDLYRVDTTPKEAFQHKELLKYSKEYYRKRGMGRPTKKDRRDIEDYKREEE